MKKGFTLIEILVSMALLMVITLIITRFFHESSIAWDGGQRKTECCMTGRALVDFIVQDISQAVDDRLYFAPILETASGISFVTLLAPSNNVSRRLALRVTYSKEEETVKRKAELMDEDGGWMSTSAQEVLIPPGMLIDLQFLLAPNRDYVDVRVVLVGQDDKLRFTGDPLYKRQQAYEARAYVVNRKRYRFIN